MINNKLTMIAFAVFSASPLISVTVNANPLYQNCTTSSSVLSGSRINVYYDENFHADFNRCTPTDDITDYEAGSLIRSATEVWNRETIGQAFVNKGSVPIGTSGESDFCSMSGISTPAILVVFDTKCDPGAVANTCNAGVSARYDDIQTCQSDINRKVIRVYGHRQSNVLAECDANGVTPIDWRINVGVDNSGSANNPKDLLSVLVHEIGHAASLGHTPTGGRIAVMDTGIAGGMFEWRHLFPWDQDCADDAVTSRSTQYHWIEYRSPTLYRSTYTNSSLKTTKSSLSSAHTRIDGISNKWGMWRSLNGQGYIMSGTRYGIGSFLPVFTFQDMHSSIWSNSNPPFNISYLAYSYTHPVFYTRQEFNLNSGENSRVSFPRVETANSGWLFLNEINPPRWYYLSTDDSFKSTGGTTSVGQYSQCVNAACTVSSLRLQSHLPLMHFWDPASERTLTLRVDTTPSTTGVADTHGRIFIHPGFTTSTSNRLRFPSELTPQNTALPASPTNHPYLAETDTIAGAACGPSLAETHFNCLLAWVDRGVPRGRVLYTWFRVDDSQPGGISWLGTASYRSGTNSVSGVSVGFTEGHFDIATRRTDLVNPDIRINSKPNSTTGYFSSWTQVDIGRTKVFDNPTWIYRHGYTTSMLTWTEL